MDAFAVSITCGLQSSKKMVNALKVGFLFGLFQAFMPVLGYFSGTIFREAARTFNYWIAFIILLIIGIRMIYESVKRDEGVKEKPDFNNIKMLLILAFATSIDAFAVGITFAFLNVNLIYIVIVIGVITFIMSVIGFIIGDRIGKYAGKSAEIIGGIVLIIIGIKIFVENIL